MISRVLYDTRNGKILKCQPKPKGSASVPSKKALLKSARVPEKVKEYCSTTIIEKELLTTECRDNYRIVEGDLISKPRLIIETIEKENNQYEVLINIEKTIESDVFSKIELKIENIEFDIDIENNKGSKVIELEGSAQYTIICDDNSFKPVKPVTLEVS